MTVGVARYTIKYHWKESTMEECEMFNHPYEIWR